MRRIVILTMTVLTVAIQAMGARFDAAKPTIQQSVAEKTLANAMEQFVASPGLMFSHEHPGTGLNRWLFKYNYAEGSGQDAPLPAALADIDRAFRTGCAGGTMAYMHNSDNGGKKMEQIQMSWVNSYWARVTFRYTFGKGSNVRLVNFSNGGGVNTLYALVWKREAFPDRDSAQCCTIDGYVLRLSGDHWRIDNMATPLFNSYSVAGNISDRRTADDVAFAQLREKIRYITSQYVRCVAEKDENGCDIMAYMMNKLGREADVRLTEEQFSEVAADTLKWKKGTGRGSMRRYAIMLEGLNRLRQENSVISSMNYTMTVANGRFMQNYIQEKTVTESYVAPQPAAKPIKGWRVTGKAAGEGANISVEFKQRRNRMMRLARTDSTLCFALEDDVYPGEFIGVTDNMGNSWTVIADSVPLSIDMRQGVTAGSRLNRRFSECQRRLKAYEREARKYTSDIDGDTEIIDTRGFVGLTGEYDDAVARIIGENHDNAIGAYYLWNNYTNMSAARLDTLLAPGNSYANHYCMQPVRQYHKGMDRRRAGTAYTDMTLTDTAGNSRRLSELVGHGKYVVLNFWTVNSDASRHELPTMKRMLKKYADKGLCVVSIALKDIAEDWKKYVRVRKLAGIHLLEQENGDCARAYGIAAIPENVVIGPDGRIVASGVVGAELEALLGNIFE